MKPSFVILLLSLALAPAAVLAVQSRPAPPRPAAPIAFVSVQRILSEATAAKTASKRLEELRKAKAEEVASKKKALDETRLALANAGGLFGGSKRAELTATEQRQEADLKQATDDAQKAFVDLQRTLQSDIRNDLSRVLDQLGREQPIQLILNTDTAVVWSRTGSDITTEVLERLNATPEQTDQKLRR
jgi:Skp family chaperone for outer membrane proteins